jgi:tetratricopeptide (TPR) repeat protein
VHESLRANVHHDAKRALSRHRNVNEQKQSSAMTKHDFNKSTGEGIRNYTKRRSPRHGGSALALSLMLALSACAVAPKVEPTAAPKVEGLPELMHRGETAQAAGDKDKAREAYRAAAKSDPTSKAPWLRLAEGYFEAADYGNAVLAAQEVLHRDAGDTVAAGILAVSGLRVSTSALGMLRQQSGINAGTRSEAETLARSLREVLGESVLVPRNSAEAASAPVRTRNRAAASAASSAKPVAAPAVKPVAVVPAVAAAKPAALPPATIRPVILAAPAAKPATPATPAAPAANPFDKLK